MDYTPIVLAAIHPFFALLSVVFTGLVGLMTLRINKNINSAKEANDATRAIIDSITELQLKNTMDLASRNSKKSKSKEDLADAIETTRLYVDYMEKQAVVDDTQLK